MKEKILWIPPVETAGACPYGVKEVQETEEERLPLAVQV